MLIYDGHFFFFRLYQIVYANVVLQQAITNEVHKIAINGVDKIRFTVTLSLPIQISLPPGPSLLVEGGVLLL